MRRRVLWMCATGMLCAMLASTTLAAGRGGGLGGGRGGRNPNQRPDPPSNTPGDQDVTTLPLPVRKTAEEEAGRGRIVDAERTMEDGEVVYEVTIRGLVFEHSVTIALDGTLLSRQVFLWRVPLAVKRTITSLERFGQVGDIYLTFEDGDSSYAVEIQQPGGKRMFTVATDGTHEATQVHLNETPAAVQNTIRVQAAGGNVFNIDRSEVDGGKVFNVLMIQGGKRRTVSIDVDGNVVGTQVYLPELPPQCQMGITQQAKGAKITYIERFLEEGQPQFDVTTTHNGTRREFTIGKDGKWLSTVVPLADVPAVVKNAIRDKTLGGRITRVDKLADEPGYEVEVERDGRKRTVSVSPDGSVE